MSWKAAMVEAFDLSRTYNHRYRVEGARNHLGEWKYWIRTGDR